VVTDAKQDAEQVGDKVEAEARAAKDKVEKEWEKW